MNGISVVLLILLSFDRVLETFHYFPNYLFTCWEHKRPGPLQKIVPADWRSFYEMGLYAQSAADLGSF
jgi:hypothetical protein